MNFHKIAVIVCIVFCFLIFSAFYFSTFNQLFTVEKNETTATVRAHILPKVRVVTHEDTPDPLKAVYMTSWVAGRKDLRKKLVDLIDHTELNAVVIDIKDYSGHIVFAVHDPLLVSIGASVNRIPDITDFIDELHQKNIYIIGRIAVFQDPFLVMKNPKLAVKVNTDKTKVWKDYKGISWIDAGSQETWDYIVALSKESYALGFDELNFDYIRFPSDGNMSDIYYPDSHGKTKHLVLRDFFAYLNKELKPIKIPLSADFFGMTTINKDDLNIGQVFEDALLYFDYVSPMVYPSHYPPNFLGFKNPADKPYEVIRYSMDNAFRRASTTTEKLRPWLQDFNLGAMYDATMIRKEIKAVTDAGGSSWMLWNAASRYTAGALDAE